MAYIKNLIALVVLVVCVWACYIPNVIVAIFYLVTLFILVLVTLFLFKVKSIVILFTILPIVFFIFLLLFIHIMFDNDEYRWIEDNREGSVFLTIFFCFLCFYFVIVFSYFIVIFLFVFVCFNFYFNMEIIPSGCEHIFNYDNIFSLIFENIFCNLNRIGIRILENLIEFSLDLRHLLVTFFKFAVVNFVVVIKNLIYLLNLLNNHLLLKYDKYAVFILKLLNILSELSDKLSDILSYIYSSWAFQFIYPYHEFIVGEAVKYVIAASKYLISVVDLIKTIDFSSLMETAVRIIISVKGMNSFIHFVTIKQLVFFLLIIIGTIILLTLIVVLIYRITKNK